MRPHVLWFDEHYGSHPGLRVAGGARGLRRDAAGHRRGTSFSVGVTELIASEAGRRGIPLFVIDPQGVIDVGDGSSDCAKRRKSLLPRVCALVGLTA